MDKAQGAASCQQLDVFLQGGIAVHLPEELATFKEKKIRVFYH